MTLGLTNNIDDLKSDFDFLSNCCLSVEQEKFNPVSIIAHYSSSDINSERTGIVIFRNFDGKIGILEDNEDYTGHGWQCSASLSWFNSEEMAWRLGVAAKYEYYAEYDLRSGLEKNGFIGPCGTEDVTI